MVQNVQGGWAAIHRGRKHAEASRARAAIVLRALGALGASITLSGAGVACGLLAFVAVNMAAVPAAAQNDADVELLTERAESFLTGLGKDAPGAFNVLLANSNLADTEEIDRMVAAAKDLPGKYGAFLKAERIEAKRVGQDLVLMTFLYKAERFPIVWRFAFYRPRENWVVVAIRFDSRLLDLKLPSMPASP